MIAGSVTAAALRSALRPYAPQVSQAPRSICFERQAPGVVLHLHSTRSHYGGCQCGCTVTRSAEPDDCPLANVSARPQSAHV